LLRQGVTRPQEDEHRSSPLLSSTYFLEEKSPSNPKKTDLSALKTGSELHSINLQQSQEVTDDYSGRVKARKED
jgi:hypothetical protein